MRRPVAYYREFAPAPELRDHVRAYFSCSADPIEGASRRLIREIVFREGDLLCAPLFADGHVSMIFGFGRACRAAGGVWHDYPAGREARVIGPMNAVGAPSDDDRAEMVGVYFRAGRAAPFVGVPAAELTDRAPAVEELWGSGAVDLHDALGECAELARIDRLEAALLRRTACEPASGGALDVPGIAACMREGAGRLSVQSLADAAGVSRQRFTRVFRERIGVTPKVFCRLARFQAALAYAGTGPGVSWAEAALDAGYADQSHMIAEFRRFSSLTPQKLAAGKWFHPFIERAKARRRQLGQPTRFTATVAEARPRQWPSR
jgi:AraC-like DNA-binding protein